MATNNIQEEENMVENYFTYEQENTRSASTNERNLVTEEFVRDLVDQKMMEFEERHNQKIDELLQKIN